MFQLILTSYIRKEIEIFQKIFLRNKTKKIEKKKKLLLIPPRPWSARWLLEKISWYSQLLGTVIAEGNTFGDTGTILIQQTLIENTTPIFILSLLNCCWQSPHFGGITFLVQEVTYSEKGYWRIDGCTQLTMAGSIFPILCELSIDLQHNFGRDMSLDHPGSF